MVGVKEEKEHPIDPDDKNVGGVASEKFIRPTRYHLQQSELIIVTASHVRRCALNATE